MFSERNRYILKLLVYLADLGRDRFVTMSSIAERLDIPRGYLNRIIPTLVDLGYVESKRGKGGGIRLARSPAECSVRVLLEEIGALDHAADDKPESCCIPTEFEQCMIEHWMDQFKETVIADTTLCDLRDMVQPTEN